ncbi:MAG: NADH-quinone oxidoreductase subunit M [Bacteroidetes bacterium]|jgi:NADH-quinone oxidoreductase subunit M|nr:NADH-quinone oxidoreductase subunit M [Bacteroidota bacterium]
MGLLSLLTFLPVVLALPLALRQVGVRGQRLAVLATLGLQLLLIAGLYAGNSLTMGEKLLWIRLPVGEAELRIHYELQLDGVAWMLCLLSTLILLTAVLATPRDVARSRLYYALLQLLNTSLIGSFLAQDLVLFYIFFELMLLPMFFLIGIWGGKRREYAAIKFFLYTLVGSLFLLLVLVGLVFSYQPEPGVHDFSLSTYCQAGTLLPGSPFAATSLRTLGFWAMFLAFAIKLPLVPVHTWLPDAHVEASTPISVILAGTLLKVGGYGLFRFVLPIFPDVVVAQQPWLLLIACVTIVYGGLVALGQVHFKRLVAYSSVSHMGFVLLGLASLSEVGMLGALLQLFTHGVISALLFLSAGVLYSRLGTLQLDAASGLWRAMPRFTFFAALGIFAALGLPGLAAFVSELLVLTGTLTTAPALGYAYAFLPFAGILLGAGYLLWAFQRLFMGPLRSPVADGVLADLGRAEWISFGIPAFFTVLIGLYPGWLLGPLLEPVQHTLKLLGL